MPKIIYKSADATISKSEYPHQAEYKNKDRKPFYKMRKDELFGYLLQGFYQEGIPVVYDKNIKSIHERVKNLNLESLPKEGAILFFTSGTTGEPTGVLKSKENILEELEVLKSIFAPLNIERIIVTVPLIHIYGFLMGVMLPMALEVDVVLKEEFLPHELISLSEGKKSLCITNPVFLRVLDKMDIYDSCEHMVFVSSTGRLHRKTIYSLKDRLGCTIYQIFGSTETGGVAYKIDTQILWRPFDGVHIGQKEEKLSVDSAFVSSYSFTQSLQKLPKPFITTDIVDIQKDGFILLGRESEIIKVSGKRVSLLEIEALLENDSQIDEALVKLLYDETSYKDEQLDIAIRSSTGFFQIRQKIKDILQTHYKNINIRANIRLVDSIPKNSMGKKLRK